MGRGKGQPCFVGCVYKWLLIVLVDSCCDRLKEDVLKEGDSCEISMPELV